RCHTFHESCLRSAGYPESPSDRRNTETDARWESIRSRLLLAQLSAFGDELFELSLDLYPRLALRRYVRGGPRDQAIAIEHQSHRNLFTRASCRRQSRDASTSQSFDECEIALLVGRQSGRTRIDHDVHGSLPVLKDIE